LPDYDFRVQSDNHAISRSRRKRNLDGLWYRGSRVRVPLATLENKGFVSEGFVAPDRLDKDSPVNGTTATVFGLMSDS